MTTIFSLLLLGLLGLGAIHFLRQQGASAPLGSDGGHKLPEGGAHRMISEDALRARLRTVCKIADPVLTDGNILPDGSPVRLPSANETNQIQFSLTVKGVRFTRFHIEFSRTYSETILSYKMEGLEGGRYYPNTDFLALDLDLPQVRAAVYDAAIDLCARARLHETWKAGERARAHEQWKEDRDAAFARIQEMPI